MAQITVSKDPHDIGAFTASSEEIISTITNIEKNQPKVFSFFDKSESVKEIDFSKKEKLNQNKIKTLPYSTLKSLSSKTGITINTDIDLEKSISEIKDKLDKEFSKYLYNIFSKLQDFQPLNKLKSTLNSEQKLLEAYDKFSITNNFDIPNNSDLHIPEVIKDINTDTVNIIQNTKDILENVSTDNNLNTIFQNIDTNIAKDIQDVFNETLHLVNDNCEELNMSFLSDVIDVSDILHGLNALLTVSINTGNSSLFDNVMNCFEKVKDILNDVKNINNIGSAISLNGADSLLDNFLNNINDTDMDFKKLLYTTFKKSTNNNIDSYNNVKTNHNIDDSSFFNVHDNKIKTIKPNIANKMKEDNINITNIIKVK